MPSPARRRSAIIVAVVAVVIGGGGLLGVVLTRHDETPSFTVATGQQNAFADSGTADGLAAVRASVVGALTAEQNAFVVTSDHTAALSKPQQVALLKKNETAARATQLADDLQSIIGTAPYLRSGRFVVERWQGVLVGAKLAKVYVTGHDEGTQVDGTPWRDPTYQARVLLQRSSASDHGWLVSTITSTSIASS